MRDNAPNNYASQGKPSSQKSDEKRLNHGKRAVRASQSPTCALRRATGIPRTSAASLAITIRAKHRCEPPLNLGSLIPGIAGQDVGSEGAVVVTAFRHPNED